MVDPNKGSSETVSEAENPDILLLQETKCVGTEAETIFQRSWHGCDFIHTDSTGASGGLAILWNPNTVTLSKTLLHHRHAHDPLHGHRVDSGR
jgi:exonuclease III